MHSVTEGRELEECLFEAAIQMERLEIEIAWCQELLLGDRSALPAG